MQKLLTQRKFLSRTENKNDKSKEDTWKEYSTLHDAFAEQLSYEKSHRRNSDFWQLNYI